MWQETFESAELLTKELAPGHGSSVVHLLSCPTCRLEAMEFLLRGSHEPVVKEAWPATSVNFDYSLVFYRIEARLPMLIEVVLGKRRETERLVGKLLRCPPESRWQEIETPGFACPAMVLMLLAASEARLRKKPREAENLARLAARLAFRLEPTLRERSSEVVQAFCLAGNARRLLGDWKQAEVSFERASLLALDRCDRGRYCRGLGLLRWEQGRSDEGMALLVRSVKLFEREEAWQEYGISQALTGLLLAEEGDHEAAYDPLVRALAALDPAVLPDLRGRAGMALALSLAHLGEKGRAQALRDEVWKALPRLGEIEQLPILWLEGKLGGILRHRKDALALLEAVQIVYLRRGRWREAILVAIDEGPLLVGRDEAEVFLTALIRVEEALASREDLGECLAELRQLGRQIGCHKGTATCDELARAVRQVLRRRGLQPEPLPYA